MPINAKLTNGSASFDDIVTENDVYDAIETIGQQVIESATAWNPLADFDKGYLDRGTIVEKINLPLTSSVEYDPNALGYRAPDYPDPVILYLNEWTPKDYYAAVNEDEARAILAGENTIEAIADRTVAILSESEIAESYTDYKALFNRFITTPVGGQSWHKESQIITGVVGNLALVKAIRDIISAFKFVNTEYSLVEYAHRTPADFIRIVIPSAVMNSLDIETYTYMYDGAKADLLAKIIETDMPANDDGTYNIFVTDIRAFGRWSRARSLRSAFNLEAGAEQYKLHTEHMYANVGMYKAACIKFLPATTALTEEA